MTETWWRHTATVGKLKSVIVKDSFAMDRHYNQSSDHQGRQWSMVVLNLDPNMNDEELFESMTQFSQIHSMKLSTNRITNRKYAYVTFEHSGLAHQPHPGVTAGRYIERKTLLVSNLHPMVTELQLLEKFAPFGSISTVQVCRNNRVCPAYAFVTFHHPRDAERAQNDLNFTNFMLKPLIVMWGPDKTTEVLSDDDSSSQGETEERETGGETEERETGGETGKRETGGETEERENSESSWGRRMANTVKSAVKAAVSSPVSWVGVGVGVCAYAYFRSRS